MALPTFPDLHLSDVNDRELTALADWLAASAATVAAEQSRRAAVQDRVRRAATWRIAAEAGDDPRWTPQQGDGARICAGPSTGWQGFVIGRCGDGCEQVDGQPRWRLHSAVTGWQTCMTREHLRPVQTVRRPGSPGRTRCDHGCLCCMGDPRDSLPRTQLLATGRR
ncbi:hypothetical protein OOJ91_12860 [Micromonospora lupini]|uniref:hypothetical protein n=1 Tax=Micromonospora lupini TaxID=285679 RepID=UPI002257CAD6|nr:hypothetical protein [Micromonospora lupini]MCX5066737.1 hypothetical protein [Micromonospora lupini]